VDRSQAREHGNLLYTNKFPPCRRQRDKGGATENWEFHLKGWASPATLVWVVLT